METAGKSCQKESVDVGNLLDIKIVIEHVEPQVTRNWVFTWDSRNPGAANQILQFPGPTIVEIKTEQRDSRDDAGRMELIGKNPLASPEISQDQAALPSVVNSPPHLDSSNQSEPTEVARTSESVDDSILQNPLASPESSRPLFSSSNTPRRWDPSKPTISELCFLDRMTGRFARRLSSSSPSVSNRSESQPSEQTDEPTSTQRRNRTDTAESNAELKRKLHKEKYLIPSLCPRFDKRAEKNRRKIIAMELRQSEMEDLLSGTDDDEEMEEPVAKRGKEK